MNIKDAVKYSSVLYIPTKDIGKISSWNNIYIFVKFNKQIEKFGWNNTTSQSCFPKDLNLI